MIPLKLILENFISHVYSELDFTQFNVALLVGAHSGNPDISNGVGKSALFDGMRWALYGKSRFSTKDKVIKRGKASCRVTFEFESNGQRYRIIRRLNKKSGVTDVSFSKEIKDEWDSDGLSCDTATMTNRKIAEVINMNDDTFVNSNYFRQNDISGFASASTAKRKEILKEVLQIGIWDDFFKIAKNTEKKLTSQKAILEERIKFIGDIDTVRLENNEKIKDLKMVVSDLRNKMAVLEDQLQKKKDVVVKLEVGIAAAGNTTNIELKKKATKIALRVKDLKSRRIRLHNEVKVNNEQFAKIESDCIHLNQKVLALLRDIALVSYKDNSDNKGKFTQLAKKLGVRGPCKWVPYPNSKYSQSSLNEKLAKRSEHQSTVNQLTQKLENLMLLEPGKECPTCLIEVKNPKGVIARRKAKQKFIENLIEEELVLIGALTNSIEEEQTMINNANEARIEVERFDLIIAKRMSAQSDLVRRNEAIQRELNDISAQWTALKQEKQAILTIAATHKDNDKMEAELNKAAIDCNNMALKVDVAKNEMLESSAKLGHLEGYGEDLERRLSERKALVEQRDKLASIIDVHANVAKAFSRDGIQAIIMENVTEDLRKYTNSILKQICNEQMSVDFVTQKQTSSGTWKEYFDIKIALGSDILDFDDLSGGEQVRMSIALRLALSQLLMRRVGSNVKFLLLDEVDQALDRQGIEALSEAINALSKNLKILVITHNESMKERFDNIITVQKGPSGSILKQ